MNSDIRVSATLLQHHKTKKLIRVLGLGVIYYLLRLWTYTAQYRPDGVLEGMTAEDIAVAIDWMDEPDDLIRPLCEIGFLEQCEEGVYRVHDWATHNPYAAHAKERSEKARKAAEARWGNAKECPEHATSMPVASPSNAPSPTPSPTPVPKKEDTPLTPHGGNEGEVVPLKKQKRFTPPSPEEVGRYCQERVNGVDPRAFCDFYASKGWMVGKNKMRDWKAAIRTWERDSRHQQSAPVRHVIN